MSLITSNTQTYLTTNQTRSCREAAKSNTLQTFNKFMNQFIMDKSVKKLNKAWYKFKDKYTDEYKLEYTICV